MSMPYYTLNNGNKMPAIGLGTVQIKDVPTVIFEAIKSGVRLIDTAKVYGNEEEIGKGITKALEENIVKREDLFIVTKVAYNERSDPKKAIEISLKKLNLSYIDLYLDHWPVFFEYDSNGKDKVNKNPMHIFWPKMENLVELGLTKNIGVSNYNVQSLCNLLSFCKIKPVCLEIEFNPYLYQKNILDFCNREDIKIIAYNPLVKGDYVPNIDIFKEPVIQKMVEKYKCTPGQVVLNWELSKGLILIPRSSNLGRIQENLNTYKIKIEQEDIDEISKLNKGARYCNSFNWQILGEVDLFA